MGGVKSIDNHHHPVSIQKEQGRAAASPPNTNTNTNTTNVNSNINSNSNSNGNSSPRSQAIRGSLMKLTKDLSNLDLPSIAVGDSNSNSNSNDNDLAARLQRLKNNIDA